ncbi:hypothetical protein COB57_00805 [Candidatus Peregrinibacteria bacterium]|nr:MAG: hypothetical protein COB57_00805 [Candidatus Peregrinibacteria bacterium]
MLIKDLIASRLKKHKLYTQVSSTLVLEGARGYLSKQYNEEITKNIEIKYIKNKKMIIYVQNSVIAQEVFFQKTELLKFLSQKFPKNIVDDIHILQKNLHI